MNKALWKPSEKRIRNSSLEKFIKLKASKLEIRERLEQLRALEANMDIKVGIVEEFPIGVDNLADFKKACDYIRSNK